jgi:hypothetical protein
MDDVDDDEGLCTICMQKIDIQGVLDCCGHACTFYFIVSAF